MRHIRWIASFGQMARRVVLAGGLSFCGWGCHQHYYYYGNPPGGTPGCPPGMGTTILPSAVTTSGPICDVSPDSSLGANSSSRSTIVSDGRKSRVVVSEPSNSKSSSFGWRPTDPEGSPAAITQVDGALDNSSVRK